MTGEKVLVTGCNGFIGSHLAARLLQEGYQVTGLDVVPPEQAQNIRPLFANERFAYIKGDVTDKALVDAAINHTITKVFHLAALVGIEKYMENPLEVVRTNVVGTLNVLDAVLRHNCYLFFSSTSEVYGKNPQIPWREDDDRVLGATSFERWSYSSSKSAAEHAVRGAFKQHSLQGCIVRFFNVYGPNQSEAFIISRNLLRAAQGKNLLMHNTGAQTRCFTYVDDAIEACIRLVEEPKANGEVFNVGAAQEHSIKQVLETIVQIAQKPLDIEVVNTEDSFGDAFEDIMRRVPNVDKIYATIGWKATTNLRLGLLKSYNLLTIPEA